MKRLLYIIIFFTFSSQSFGQILIKGVVSNTENESLPGVNVIEVGTKNGAITDIDGQYKLEVTDTSSVLEFSFVGLITKSQTVGNKKELNVKMEADTASYDELIFTCYFPVRYTEFGYSSGINFTPIGFKVKNQTPYIWGVNLGLESSIIYRQKDSNEYIDFYLRKYSIFSIKNSGIGIKAEYKKFSTINASYNEFTITPTIGFKGILWSIGYTKQIRKSIDTDNAEVNGLYLGLNKNFSYGFSLFLGSQYLLDLWQFNLNFSKHFYKPNLTIAFGYERFYKFDEFEAAISYRINY